MRINQKRAMWYSHSLFNRNRIIMWDIKKRRGLAYLSIFLGIFVLASCERFDPLLPVPQEKKNLAIGIMLGPISQEKESPINLLKIKSVDITLKGAGIETIDQKIDLDTYAGKVNISMLEGKKQSNTGDCQGWFGTDTSSY